MTKPSVILGKLDTASFDIINKMAVVLVFITLTAATIYTGSLAMGIILTLVAMAALAIAAPILGIILYGAYTIFKLIKLYIFIHTSLLLFLLSHHIITSVRMHGKLKRMSMRFL